MSTPAEAPFSGIIVATFEARLATAMADLIRKQGGTPLAAPALREIPIDDNADIFNFADHLIAGDFDVVIFETGVGVRYLTQAIETRIPRDDWLAALSRAKIVARGPKPVAALRELKARIDLQVPEPNTWHETLATLDSQLPVAGLRIAVQEYGKPIPELIEGLEKRGARVTRLPVYRWSLPEDTGPLRAAIAEIAAGRVAIVLFTAAQQVVHLVQVAEQEGQAAQLRDALARHTVVGSIGPATSQALREHSLPIDIEPDHPKMGHLVAAVAAGWRGVGKVASTTDS
jgi:uroporphyrinogen-III synthase